MLWRMSAGPSPERIGIMFARLDDLPQHRGRADVDFRASMRYERIPGRRGRRTRNSVSYSCRAELSAIGKTLAEIAEIAGLPAARNSG